ncbi:hypothetical protein PR048_013717 [Dryococelus australis]|uniref:Uncharacterized protein n=1 Tax=Dryococelus australis TaxID=614101 RepID=A0ABQ9HT01_9NEOP|nr:hypothetical protein PR048_013717 [Dryococelus australis]
MAEGLFGKNRFKEGSVLRAVASTSHRLLLYVARGDPPHPSPPTGKTPPFPAEEADKRCHNIPERLAGITGSPPLLKRLTPVGGARIFWELGCSRPAVFGEGNLAMCGREDKCCATRTSCSWCEWTRGYETDKNIFTLTVLPIAGIVLAYGRRIIHSLFIFIRRQLSEKTLSAALSAVSIRLVAHWTACYAVYHCRRRLECVLSRLVYSTVLFILEFPLGLTPEYESRLPATVTAVRDDEFWRENMFPKLRIFDTECLLPELADSRISRGMRKQEPPYILEAQEGAKEKKQLGNKNKRDKCLPMNGDCVLLPKLVAAAAISRRKAEITEKCSSFLCDVRQQGPMMEEEDDDDITVVAMFGPCVARPFYHTSFVKLVIPCDYQSVMMLSAFARNALGNPAPPQNHIKNCKDSPTGSQQVTESMPPVVSTDTYSSGDNDVTVNDIIDEREHEESDNAKDDGYFLDALTRRSSTFAETSDMKKAEDAENIDYLFTEDPNELFCVDTQHFFVDIFTSQQMFHAGVTTCLDGKVAILHPSRNVIVIWLHLVNRTLGDDITHLSPEYKKSLKRGTDLRSGNTI